MRPVSPNYVCGVASPVPSGAHEWVSFPDPEEDRTWVFDVTFLESSWTCIFGQGCHGVLTGPADELIQGCCSYGAHFTGKKDLRRVSAAAATLTDDQWQYRSKALPKGKERSLRFTRRSKDGTFATRIVAGACIFLNRPEFPGGAGCALHRAALERDQPPLELKPDVCWQLPLRREDTTSDDGWVTSTVRQWDRRDWGPGGDEFHWWCTESPDAFVGKRPVWKELQGELEAMVGKPIFRRLARFLAARAPDSGYRAGVPVAVTVKHPALRRS